MIRIGYHFDGYLEMQKGHPYRKIANLQASAEAAHTAWCQLQWADDFGNAPWRDSQAATRSATQVLRPSPMLRGGYTDYSLAAMIEIKREAAETALGIYRYLFALSGERTMRLNPCRLDDVYARAALSGLERRDFVWDLIAQCPEGKSWLERRLAREAAEAERHRHSDEAQHAALAAQAGDRLLSEIEAAGTVLTASKDGASILASGTAVSEDRLARLKDLKPRIIEILTARKAAATPKAIA
jgi:hypothetical protein